MIVSNLIVGALAGAVAKTSIAPLDRTKIHFQIHDTKFSLKGAAIFLKDTYSQHGITALWRGNSATMVRIMPYAAIQFTSHEHFKHWFKVDTNERKKNRKMMSFLAGSCAGIFTSICTYPLDLARARMALSQCDIKLRNVLTDLIKEGGYRSLYRGCTPSIIGIVPYAGTTFFTYETAKRIHHERTGLDQPDHVSKMAFGALAGLLGQTASYPLDVVRRRMQTSPTRLGMVETVCKILTDEKPLRSFYRGMTLNWVKGPISVGISFTIFDLLSRKDQDSNSTKA